MKLYHGSLIPVENPRIMEKEFYRPLDFGTGFYTTTSFEQALRWVMIRLELDKSKDFGYVMSYDFNEAMILNAQLKVKKFEGVSSEWLHFVAENRLQGNVEHGYDIVTGPVANDRVYTVLNLFEGGFIDEVNAMSRMKAHRLADQMLFHTEKALVALRYLSSQEIHR